MNKEVENTFTLQRNFYLLFTEKRSQLSASGGKK